MCKVLIVNECHLQKTPDGRYWSDGIVDAAFFKRYSYVFEEVYVAIRVKKVDKRDNRYNQLCNSKKIRFLPIPEFVGISGYIQNSITVTKIIKQYCNMVDCAIVRTPSAISFQFLRHIDGKMPYALEVSGDPWNHMAPGMYKSIARPVIRRMWTELLRKYCMKANGVSYVTEKTLQKKYPCRAIVKEETQKYFTSCYSSVKIFENAEFTPKVYEKKDEWIIVHVTNAVTTYSKGHKEVLDVLRLLNINGFNVSAQFIGDGPLLKEFERYADKLGIKDKIHFLGRINEKNNLYCVLRDADLFLFPSHSEGLPRVLIESMHTGTPCVATNVGGIPELLRREYITDIGDVNRMFAIIKELFSNPDKLTTLSREAINKAKEYSDSSLQARRNIFFEKLKEICI